MSRSFFVKLNLDDVGHAIIEYDDAESLGLWFKGYLVGAHGRPLRPDAIGPYQAGHAYGLAAFHDAEAFRAKQAVNGALGGRPIKPKETQTLPKPNPDETQTVSQTITQTKPIEHLASSIENLEAKIEKREARAFAPPTLDEAKSYCDERGNSVDLNRWFGHYEANGWMVGKTKMKSWKGAIRTWEPDGFIPKDKRTAGSHQSTGDHMDHMPSLNRPDMYPGIVPEPSP